MGNKNQLLAGKMGEEAVPSPQIMRRDGLLGLSGARGVRAARKGQERGRADSTTSLFLAFLLVSSFSSRHPNPNTPDDRFGWEKGAARSGEK